jgi:hypothetical protein
MKKPKSGKPEKLRKLVLENEDERLIYGLYQALGYHLHQLICDSFTNERISSKQVRDACGVIERLKETLSKYMGA